MACPKYEALEQELFAAMKAEDEAPLRSPARVGKTAGRPHTARASDRRDGHLPWSLWHVQQCEVCKAEGNKPFEYAPY